MPYPFRLIVNGTEHNLLVESHETLAAILRDHLHLTGTKVSCGAGDCGACTVLVDGKAVNSCIVLALSVQEASVQTIEGLYQGGKLHPIQEAFLEAGAIQCGFCTPGMVMAAKGLLDQNPFPSEREIRKGLSGNICRCTGYEKIIQAVQIACQKKGLHEE